MQAREVRGENLGVGTRRTRRPSLAGSNPRRAAVGAALSLAVVVLGACSSGSSTGERAKSNTPRIQSTARELQRGVVTAEELRAITGLPRLQPVPLKNAPLFENPDPRGPCGARISQPDFPKRAIAVFAANSVMVFEAVARLDEGTARAFVDSIIADAKPGCPPFESLTNTGAQQTVIPGITVELPQLSDQQIARTESISVLGHSNEAAEVLIRRGGLVALAAIFAERRVPVRTVQQFAAAVNSALGRLS